MAEGDGRGRALTLDAEEVQGDGLSGIRGIHHFDNDLARARIEDGGGEETILACLSGHGLLVHRERQYVGALVHGEELLHIVAHRLKATEIIEPDGKWPKL